MEYFYYLFIRPQVNKLGKDQLFLKYSGYECSNVSELFRYVWLKEGYPGEFICLNFVRKCVQTESQFLAPEERSMINR